MALRVERRLTSEQLLETLAGLFVYRGVPKHIRSDNGPEFTSRALDAWAYERGIELHFITPGKPSENATVESFNARVRDKRLNQHCFFSMDEARAIIEDFQTDYNTIRPHGLLQRLTSQEFASDFDGG